VHCPRLNQGGTAELFKPPSLGIGMEAFVFLQTAENDRQLRSRLEDILNVPQRVRLRCLLHLRPCWTIVLNSLNRREVKP
jgi:hypothetical protein